MTQITAKTIFNDIQALNGTVSSISSMGDYISETAQIVADAKHAKITEFVPADSLAGKILADLKITRYTEKQLWVIAYELLKNEAYVAMLSGEAEKAEAISDEKKSKLAENKAGSQNVLDFVKSRGFKLADYYAFLKKDKQFSKEFYSKKYTLTSAEEFVNTVKN